MAFLAAEARDNAELDEALRRTKLKFVRVQSKFKLTTIAAAPLLCAAGPCVGARTNGDIGRLLWGEPSEYDYLTRPGVANQFLNLSVDQCGADEVEIYARVLKIWPLNEQHSTMKLSYFFEDEWQDSRLAW